MNTTTRSATVLIATGLVGCGGDPLLPGGDQAVQVKESPIVGGLEISELFSQWWGLVAVFHPPRGGGAGWNLRPCSGRVVKSVSGHSYILTARHCMTDDGLWNGTEASLDRLRVLPRANVGIADHGPPAEALTPESRSGAPLAFGSDQGDIAIIGVAANWEGFVQPHGVWLGAPSALTNLSLASFGYGITDLDFQCDTDLSTVGAGVARMASPARLVTGSAPFAGGGFYTFSNPNSNGQTILCGDSGGPDLAFLAGRYQQVGVHHTVLQIGEVAVGASIGNWVQDRLGGAYLSPGSAQNMNTFWDDRTTLQVSLRDNAQGAASGTPLHYDPLTQQIYPQSMLRCMTPGNPVPIQDPCSQDQIRQRWSLGTDGRLVNVADGTCLTASGTTILTTTCGGAPAASQIWAFHPQPRDPASALYRFCAGENQSCSFNGTREVRYGANGFFAYRLVTNGTACNNTVFGDPIVGTVKQCHIGLDAYSFCAQENGTCSFTGKRLVAYGANGTYVYRHLTNGTACSNSVFTDPVPGVIKRCFVM